MTALSATSFALVLILGAFFRESSADEGFFRNRGLMPESLQALLHSEGDTQVLGKVDSFKASGTQGSSGTVTVTGELELPALAALPQHDCHIEVQVTERVRGHCSALTLLGKSFPVCKNGDRISVNNHECAHMAA
uniref:Putative conserved secreted protein synganglion overexpressed n=1 Tax=Rhipicephalus microplus TaxID=6941 RepID=A0A6M2D7C8_RHIMP